MREQILNEIRRLAAAAEGKPPGKKLFAQETGIREHQWNGVFWSRWGDAIAEAGLERNVLQGRYDSSDVLLKIVQACRYYKRLPRACFINRFGLKLCTFACGGVSVDLLA